MTLGSSSWARFGRVALFFVASASVLIATSILASGIAGVGGAVATGIVTAVATFGLTLLFTRWERISLADVGAAPVRGSAGRFAIGFALGLVLVAIHSAIIGSLGHVGWQRREGIEFTTIALMFVVYLLLSCREELAFRGYPLRRLYSLSGLLVAQLVVAIVFAAEHVAGGQSWQQALTGPAVGSLLFGMAAIATRGLALPIGIHAAWNFADWLRGGKDATGVWQEVVPTGYETEAQRVGMAGYLAVMALSILLCWWWYRRSSATLPK